jgi:hypothetical protein
MHSQKSSKIISVTVKGGGIYTPYPHYIVSVMPLPTQNDILVFGLFPDVGVCKLFTTRWSRHTCDIEGSVKPSGTHVIEGCTTDSFIMIRESVLTSDALSTGPSGWFILT